MFSSKGFLNLRIIALLLALIAGIKPIDSLIFYGRNVEILNKSEIIAQPAARDDGAGVNFTLENKNGHINCTLSYCGQEGWRLQSSLDGETSEAFEQCRAEVIKLHSEA